MLKRKGVKYNYKIHTIIAFKIICLLIFSFGQTTHSSAKVVCAKNFDSISEFVIGGNYSAEIYADILAEQEELDSHFILPQNIRAGNQQVFSCYLNAFYKSTQLFSSILLIFHSDLPPPSIFA